MTRILIFTLLFLISAPAFAQVPETTAKQAYIIDYDTGTVLFEKDAEARMPTSSMSKVMTMIAVFQALHDGRLKLDGELPVSETAWRMQGSKMFVDIGSMIKVEDLIRGVIVQSGNDATIVLAEALAGSEQAFGTLITKIAHDDIGMVNSNFVNASGWPDPQHYSTAHDLALMARYLIQHFPEEYKYYSEKDFTYNGIKQGNRNPLLYRDIGADGVKTGHTEEGGYGLIGSAARDGRRVIMVLNGMDSMATRASESVPLIEWALRSFQNRTLFKGGTVIEQAEVVYGQSAQVGLTIEKDVLLTLPLASAKGMTAEISYNGPLVAPIAKGAEVGKLTVNVDGLKPMAFPLIAADNVAEQTFFQKTLSKIKIYLGQNL